MAGFIYREGFIRRSYISMAGFICREGFIYGVHIYLWRDSYIGRNSYKDFTCIYDRIHIRSSHASMEGFI